MVTDRSIFASSTSFFYGALFSSSCTARRSSPGCNDVTGPCHGYRPIDTACSAFCLSRFFLVIFISFIFWLSFSSFTAQRESSPGCSDVMGFAPYLRDAVPVPGGAKVHLAHHLSAVVRRRLHALPVEGKREHAVKVEAQVGEALPDVPQKVDERAPNRLVHKPLRQHAVAALARSLVLLQTKHRHRRMVSRCSSNHVIITLSRIAALR
eukprot:8332224-Pyramimonas_sp.AAC.1